MLSRSALFGAETAIALGAGIKSADDAAVALDQTRAYAGGFVR